MATTNNKHKAHTRYYGPNGMMYPGVTTVLSILNKPGLIVWANRLGLQGIDSTKYRDNMADIGTIAHAMATGYLTETPPDLSEYSKADISVAENCMLSFYEWCKGKEIKPIYVETPMVSDIYGYGGTPDFFGYVDGKLELIDFKTGKGLYHEYFYQLAAYRQMVIERGYTSVNRARLLRIGRDENEGFEERLITRFDNEFKMFEHCLAIYRLLKTMERSL